MSEENGGVNYRFVSSINTESGDVENKMSFFGEVTSILEDEIAVLESEQVITKANTTETLRKMKREVSNAEKVLDNSYREVNPKRIKTSSSRTVEATQYIETITLASKSVDSFKAAIALFTKETVEAEELATKTIKQKVGLIASLLG